MKKLTALLLCIALIFSLVINVMAAGTDDGSLTVAQQNGKKYLGTEIAEDCVKYLAADGSGGYFYDLNADKTMNICDLVALVKNEVDIDESNGFTAADSEFLRLLLIDGSIA